jgi:hypothetical protein
MTRLEKARQRPNEDPREFHAYLDTLEQHFPQQAEKERALVFFSKLDIELRLYIQRHLLKLPDNQDRMVTVATHYHSLLSMQQPKRKREESGRPQERNQPKHPQRSFSSNTRGQRGRPSIYRWPLHCYSCGSEQHLANQCPTKNAQIQSVLGKDKQLE